MMCQNWYSVFGLCADVVGFLIIAMEWFHQFEQDHDRRIYELEKASKRIEAILRGDPRELLARIRGVLL
jgi:hypothetical protein